MIFLHCFELTDQKSVRYPCLYDYLNQIGIYIVCLALPCLFFKTKINLFVLGAITGVNRVVVNRKGIFTRDRQPKSAARYLKLRYLNL